MKINFYFKYGKEKKETKKEEKAKEVKQELTIEEKFAELNDKHLRLFAEFENFKKRTAKERMDLYKTAGESVLTALLPVLDDFERSIKANQKQEDEGVVLIYNKLKSILDDAKKQYFTDDYQDKATYEETLGLLVSKFCKWDGNKIFKVSTEAFEDSNFHTFNEKFNDLWEKEVA